VVTGSLGASMHPARDTVSCDSCCERLCGLQLPGLLCHPTTLLGPYGPSTCAPNPPPSGPQIATTRARGSCCRAQHTTHLEHSHVLLTCTCSFCPPPSPPFSRPFLMHLRPERRLRLWGLLRTTLWKG
jgi:hypothetical protein